ncbi:unnamed protein product [Lecanosticta acicola]|uniref:Unnamed protein product n=1 Tax=Lecanosticta acicola TaxID=111012 RepID=A0AAI8YS84_9PEZI|nr:unnamed protein product [Lecanosticta acicola]
MLPSHGLTHRGATLTRQHISANSPWERLSRFQSAIRPPGRGLRSLVWPWSKLSPPTGTSVSKVRSKALAKAASRKTHSDGPLVEQAHKAVKATRRKPVTVEVVVLSDDNELLGTAEVKEPRKGVRKPKEVATHHDLESYLRFAKASGKNLESRLHKGTVYEYTVQKELRTYGFSLQHRGRTKDLGIDLIGSWKLPSAPGQLQVVIQCKAGKNTSAHIRELEGTALNAPYSHRVKNKLALLISATKATTGVLEAMQRSQLPMAFAYISRDGLMHQFTTNVAAEEVSLNGLSQKVVYIPVSKGGILRKPRVKSAVQLLWEGKPWPGRFEDHYVS